MIFSIRLSEFLPLLAGGWRFRQQCFGNRRRSVKSARCGILRRPDMGRLQEGAKLHLIPPNTIKSRRIAELGPRHILSGIR